MYFQCPFNNCLNSQHPRRYFCLNQLPWIYCLIKDILIRNQFSLPVVYQRAQARVIVSDQVFIRAPVRRRRKNRTQRPWAIPVSQQSASHPPFHLDHQHHHNRPVQPQQHARHRQRPFILFPVLASLFYCCSSSAHLLLNLLGKIVSFFRCLLE